MRDLDELGITMQTVAQEFETEGVKPSQILSRS